MPDLVELAKLIRERNRVAGDIATLISRPAQVGHVGEYIASQVFEIALERNAAHKAIDGHFRCGPLAGRSVNVKCYTRQEGLLDITSDALPDYYLVLAGPRSGAVAARGATRPWVIELAFLFDAKELVGSLRERGVKVGVATSVARSYWEGAEIHPNQRNSTLRLSEEQHSPLRLFRVDLPPSGRHNPCQGAVVHHVHP